MRNDDDNLGSKSIGEPKWRFKSFFSEVSDDFDRRLKILHTELMKVNPSLQIIPSKTETDADYLHFADSYIACKNILAKDKSPIFYDIAPGNIITGLIMALLAPDRKVVVVDIAGPKIDFVKSVAAQMGLSNIQGQTSRVEDLSEDLISSAIIKGPLPITKYLLLMRKPIIDGGRLHLLKGNNWAREVGEIPSQICTFWKPELNSEYELPISGARVAVVTAIKR